jgi:hypothetical protein
VDARGNSGQTGVHPGRPPCRRDGRSPRGPVAIRIVDPTVHAKIKPYVAIGTFFLIPLSPLSPQTTYTASATVHSKAGTTITKTWSFRTA